MAMNVNRWVKYAKARIDAAVGQGNESLDRLEAERQAELAERPWLGADGTAPSLDEARARIEWEARQQERGRSEQTEGAGATGGGDRREPEPAPSDAPGTDSDGTDTGLGAPSAPDPGPRAPDQVAADAEHEAARLELEDRSRRSADRLAQIRQELGVEDPPG